MRRTNLYLDERQTAALDQLAHAEGVSRAELIRRLIDQSLDAEAGGIENDLAVIDASFGALAGHPYDGTEAPPRGPDERAVHLERLRRG